MRLYIERFDKDETGYTDGPAVQVSDDDGVFQTFTPDEFEKFDALAPLDKVMHWNQLRAEFESRKTTGNRVISVGADGVAQVESSE